MAAKKKLNIEAEEWKQCNKDSTKRMRYYYFTNKIRTYGFLATIYGLLAFVSFVFLIMSLYNMDIIEKIPLGDKEVTCFDKNGNEIKGVVCVEKEIRDYNGWDVLGGFSALGLIFFIILTGLNIGISQKYWYKREYEFSFVEKDSYSKWSDE